MANTKTTVAAAVVGSALALAGITAGATVAAADPTPPPSSTPSAPSTPSDNGDKIRPHGPGRISAADLAKKLGLSEDKVSEALQAAREELRTDRGEEPRATSRTEWEAELAKVLAEKRGVEQEAVEKALAELREADQADALASLKERLAEAVKAGTLTQAEADAVVKAAEAGVIPATHGPR